MHQKLPQRSRPRAGVLARDPKKAIAALDALRSMAPVEIRNDVQVPIRDVSVDHTGRRIAARVALANYKRAAKVYPSVLADGDPVIFPIGALRRLRSHSADLRMLQMVPHLPELVSRSIAVGFDEETDPMSPSVYGYQHYVVKAHFVTGDAYIHLVLREESNGLFFCDAHISSAQDLERP